MHAAAMHGLARPLSTFATQLEGNVASKEKMVKQQGDELVNLRVGALSTAKVPVQCLQIMCSMCLPAGCIRSVIS